METKYFLTSNCYLTKTTSTALFHNFPTRKSRLKASSFSKNNLQLWSHAPGYQGLDEGEGLVVVVGSGHDGVQH